jgi:hypothetical protein
MRWIVFNDETAEAVVSQWRRGGAEISHDHPVDAALQAGESSVLVLPSRVPGQLLVARFHMRTPFAALAASLSPAVAPTEKDNSDAKPWWRKFVA